MDWQTTTAATIVLITLAIFLVRMSRKKGKSSCGGGCGCDKSPKP